MSINKIKDVSKILRCSGILILFLLMGITVGMAQENMKIGVVDIREVYNRWTVKIDADKHFQPDRDKVNEKKKALEAADESLTKRRAILNAEQVKAEEAKLKKLADDMKKAYDEIFPKIDAKAAELSKELDGLLDRAFEDLAKKDGYTLLLDSRSVRYSSKTMDVTDKVSKFVNAASAK